MSDNNGWETYSKLVLQQLETLSSGIEGLRGELQDMKEQLTELKAKEGCKISKHGKKKWTTLPARRSLKKHLLIFKN